ncbi:hypothetical protein niasHT_000322 [Heterodera trifolii]|uniref:Amiloride-sensitive sodium channel n=1 Tax=Heterodera trifolii TaxID=157864 RepID=A0ABD2LUL7_9BILA
MTRGADRLLRHFAANSLESAQNSADRPIRRQRPMSNAVFVYRHALSSSTETDTDWSLSLARELGNATGSQLRPVGSIVRRASRPNQDTTNRVPLRPPSAACHRPPSPPTDPAVHSINQMPSNEQQKSPVPSISIASEEEATEDSQKKESTTQFAENVPTTADELMQLLMEDDGTDRPVIFTIFEAANIDGVKHLSSKNRCTRYTWLVLIILFIGLCFYQIGAQAMMYWLTPVATNIVAVYPASLAFPVIAICNNNQHRLSWLAGESIQKRRPNGTAPLWFRSQLNQLDVFDRVLLNGWDMEAGRFLRSAAHQRNRMIIQCELPNGSRCSAKDFKPLWTLTGLCWAINTDFDRPMEVTGAGPGNALRLLVNVERYERVESCTPKLRSRSLPGLKVLIINQTDIPVSFLEGVNVPAGFTMDIPFWMRQRQKLRGRDCVVMGQSNGEGEAKESSSVETEEKLSGGGKGEMRDCLMGSYLKEIERRCNCSMRKAFLKQDVTAVAGELAPLSPCNVLQYFNCVQSVLDWAKNKGFTNFGQCPVPCESIDYTAWQDMNELPTNIFPRIISFGNENEEETAELGEEDEEGTEEEHHCTHSQMLSGQSVGRIKRAAREALETQARYQEDIQIRTRRMVAQLRQSVQRLMEMRWGWRQNHFMGVHKHLSERLPCYAEVPKTHANVFNAMANPKPQGEEERAEQLQELLMGEEQKNDTKRAKSFEEVKWTFGPIAEERQKEMLMMRELTKMIYSLFSADSFTKRLPIGLQRMDKVLKLAKMYEEGQMTKESWAERMQTRNMRHFLEEDIYEDWHNLLVRDMEQNVLEVINKIEELSPQIYQKSSNGTAISVLFPVNCFCLPIPLPFFSTGSVLLFGNVRRGSENVEQLANFLDDAFECIFNGIRNETAQMLKEFQRAMLELHSALAMLFRKELPEYLQNMEFGPKFIRENFAQVNVFLHKMNIEYWRQEPTYSIWSFFCDIGATMSLFLGASMLTIIEVLYFVLRQSRIYRSIAVWRQRKNSLKMTTEAAEENVGTKNEGKERRTSTFMWV